MFVKGCHMILPVEFANKVRREPDDVKFVLTVVEYFIIKKNLKLVWE